MLDQNTDRMWYVIGAVLVGAAIILIANSAMPEVFASVTNSFETVASGALESIDEGLEKGPDLINRETVDTNKRVNQTDGKLINDSIEISTDYMAIEGGSSYSFGTPSAITKRVSYYTDRSEDSFIEGAGHYIASSKDWVTTAPANANYARISADYKNGNDAPLEDWYFGKVR